MGKKYSNEFKETIVELLKSGKLVKEVSEEYELNDSMIRRWRREYNERSGDLSNMPKLSEEQEELKQLRKELREGRVEK